jgi:UDP-glucose-4-epimerase GalE
MARVLITGGAGYVGSHCAKALAAGGHEGIVFDNLFRGRREFVRWGPLVEGDIRDGAALRAVLSSGPFDVVMHFAALAYVGESVVQPGQYYDINVAGTRVLLDTMVETGVAAIVFSSSCAVYGEPSGMPIVESTPLMPINPYGFGKLACERMIDDFERAYGLRSVRLRYFNAAGADPDGDIGEHHDPETHLIPLAIDAAIRRREAVFIFGSDYPTPDGTAIRDYVHVVDLANAHVRAVDHLLAGGPTVALNLGAGRGTSVAEIIACVRTVTGRDVPVREAPRRAGDPAVLVADPALAKSRLEWSARRSDIASIVADAWRWHERRFASASGK